MVHLNGRKPEQANGVGALLRYWREQAGLTQEQLAEHAGLSARTIRSSEGGQACPRAQTVRLLAEGLGLDELARTRLHAAAHQSRCAPRPALPADRLRRPADLVVPAQLPPDIVDFTGRADMVERFGVLLVGAPDDAARSTAMAVTAVVGAGGVGKTTLAVHIGHRVRARFPDGQLFIDLRGAEASPADPREVLGRFLRALGVDGSAIPEEADERADLYRSLLAGRRVLVVLDNAGGEAQVRPLLPGSPTCAVLVTSRTRLGGLEGARMLDVDLLYPAQAMALLGRIVGRERVAAEPAAAAELARLCGFLPLALRLAGARLAARPHWRLVQLAERLANERQRLDELAYGHLAVRASLTLSYRALEPTARLLFGRLGLLHAPDVTAWIAAALLDTSVEQATELADRLVDARLLEVAGRDATGQVRYRFHDLVRLYARERAEAEDPPAERSAALARAFGAWLHLAERADARLGNPFLEPAYGPTLRSPVEQAITERLLADPLAWLQAERAALVTAVTQAASLGLAGLSWELASALTQFFATGVYLDDWRHCAEQALAVARQAQDARGEAAVLLSLGTLHEIHGRNDEALGCWQAALTIFQRLADETGQAMCLAALALYRSDRTAYEQRRGQAEDALAILGQGGSPRARACVLHCVGILDHNHGRVELARRCFEEALRLHRGLGNRRAEAELLYRLGIVCLKQGRDDEAAGMLRQALASMRQHGDRLNAALAEVGLGTALVHLGREAQARPLLEPWAHSGFPIVEGWALRALGELDRAHGRHHHARAALQQALRVFRELDIPAEEAMTERALAALDGDGATHPDAHPARARAAPRR
jgi:tetratricopeptide (TPR) repeat protein/transcriptional regulator with XRE-family HTH domain